MRTGCVKKPCNGWEVPEGCELPCHPDDELLAELFDEAAEWVFHETCGQFPGACDAEVRPCPPCGCVCSCRCGNYRQIDLANVFCYPILRYPIGHPLEGQAQLDVVVNGEVVPADQWRLEADGVTLAACGLIAQCGSFPAQDMCKQNGDPGTWSIRARIGCPPPKMLLRGTALLAIELWKSCNGQANCLPAGVRSIQRRGLSMDVGGDLSETVRFDDGSTGISVLDLALRRYGCQDQTVAAFFDPLSHLRAWTFTGVAPATPVQVGP